MPVEGSRLVGTKTWRLSGPILTVLGSSGVVTPVSRSVTPAEIPAGVIKTLTTASNLMLARPGYGPGASRRRD